MQIDAPPKEAVSEFAFCPGRRRRRNDRGRFNISPPSDASVDQTEARNATWVIGAAVPTTSRLTTSLSLPNTSPPAGVTVAQKVVGEMPGAIWRTLPSTDATSMPMRRGVSRSHR
jgi:hypothetical protein